MEEIWLSPDTLAKVRNGDLPELLDARSATSDLFDLDVIDADSRYQTVCDPMGGQRSV
jgi:RHH-type rel operon transcriptional repressor/antitoxin RelB